MNRFDRHCGDCGYEGEFEDIPQRGSDVIPTKKCPECGNVAAIRCSCETPAEH